MTRPMQQFLRKTPKRMKNQFSTLLRLLFAMGTFWELPNVSLCISPVLHPFCTVFVFGNFLLLQAVADLLEAPLKSEKCLQQGIFQKTPPWQLQLANLLAVGRPQIEAIVNALIENLANMSPSIWILRKKHASLTPDNYPTCPWTLLHTL